MPKLTKAYQFWDLSDYGRPLACIIAESIKDTFLTPVHVTIGFIISGLCAIVCILNGQFLAAAFFLVLKSILDAADGELSRIRNKPSFTGRYFDSIADIILNFLFVLSIWYITPGHIGYALLSFVAIQLQGTLYNYYYVILRKKINGDSTSRIFETKVPDAEIGESQAIVNVLHKIFISLYGGFDKAIYLMDKEAVNSNHLPGWFMTMVSIFGLGFQLLLMGIMLVLNLGYMIIPFFIGYALLIPVFITIRRLINAR